MGQTGAKSALMALQGVEGPLEKRRRAVKRGAGLLDRLDEMKLAPDGFARKVRAFNGQIPGPVIRGKKGDRFIITVVNNLPDSSSVHWHGVEQQGLGVYADGVPMLTQWFAIFIFHRHFFFSLIFLAARFLQTVEFLSITLQ